MVLSSSIRTCQRNHGKPALRLSIDITLPSCCQAVVVQGADQKRSDLLLRVDLPAEILRKMVKRLHAAISRFCDDLSSFNSSMPNTFQKQHKQFRQTNLGTNIQSCHARSMESHGLPPKASVAHKHDLFEGAVPLFSRRKLELLTGVPTYA